jgi:hypothetical protein
MERPGEITLAVSIFTAYLGWCEQHEPEAPLSRSGFDRILGKLAPSETRVLVPCEGRGRPRIALRGVALGPPIDSTAAA